jgi:uncharacterized membrane protein
MQPDEGRRLEERDEGRRFERLDEGRRLEDVIGGRVLGWAGGLAVLVGLVYFLVVASSRGWIGEEARVAMAAGASLLLLIAGAWLHERRGRTEAALTAAATGIAGLFAATVVAGPVYGLVPALPAVTIAIGVGALATLLALRWEAPGMGWFGILGALASPVLVGAGHDPAGIAMMLVAYSAAGAVMLWQRWHALAGTAFLVAAYELLVWLVGGPADPGPAAVVAALGVFGLVSAVAAAGFEWHARSFELRASAHVLLALNALALGGLGAVGLGGTALDAWLVALAVAHVAAGLLARRSRRVTEELGLALAGLGIVLADVAFASIADGLPLVLGWAAGSVGFSVLARAARRESDLGVALAGLGGHLLLAIGTALTGVAPLAAVESGAPDQAVAVAALAALAAAAWAAARLVAPRLPELRLGLDALALVALGLVSAAALDGATVTLALAGEAIALAALAPRRRAGGGGPRLPLPAALGRSGDLSADPLPFPAALAFLGAALAHALGVLPHPVALIAGVEDPLATAIAGGGLVAAGALVARAAADARLRLALESGAAVLVLYVASVLLVTPFQPRAGTAGLALAELDVRQQGQALLSSLWALAGVAALVVGLVRDSRALRLGALALLTVTVAKVFVYDLAALTSLYRVGSCIALGLLLLAGAFAWQRIRPRPLPDLRGVPGALR